MQKQKSEGNAKGSALRTVLRRLSRVSNVSFKRKSRADDVRPKWICTWCKKPIMLGEVSYHWAYKNLHLCDKCGRKYDDSSNCGMVDMLSRSRVRNRTHGVRDRKS